MDQNVKKDKFQSLCAKHCISCLLTTARRFLGSMSSFVMVGHQIPHEHECFMFAAVIMIGLSWWFRGVFCSSLVLFEHSMKPRETAVEQESLQAAYSFFK